MAWRAGTGFANTHTDPREQQHPEVRGQTAQGGHGTPDHHGNREDLYPATSIRQGGNGDA